MKLEWDEAKNAGSIEKHGVSFAMAALIFDGPVLTFEDGRLDYGEQRLNSIGSAAGVVILTVTHTGRQGVTRIISARPASRRERKRYDDAA